MNEQIIYFGENRNLLGILTIPEQARPGAPTVVLLNAGLLHRVGPNRLHVTVARRLAAKGYPSFRFDMAGVGDSELVEGGLLYVERTRADVVASMDALDAHTGSNRFLLMGLCTGAYNAFRAALIDERVVGCILLDGYSYPSLRSQIQHYRKRVFQLKRWVDFTKRKLGIDTPAGSAVQGDLVVFENEVVPKERFASELQTLIQRNVRLLLVYTGLGPLSFTYRRQLHDAFPDIALDDVATVQFYPAADHTFTLPGHRQRLLDDLDTWLADEFELETPALD